MIKGAILGTAGGKGNGIGKIEIAAELPTKNGNGTERNHPSANALLKIDYY